MCMLLMARLPLPKSNEDEHRLLSITQDRSAGIWVETKTEFGYFNFTSPAENVDYVGLQISHDPLLGARACWYNFNIKDLARLAR